MRQGDELLPRDALDQSVLVSRGNWVDLKVAEDELSLLVVWHSVPRSRLPLLEVGDWVPEPRLEIRLKSLNVSQLLDSD